MAAAAVPRLPLIERLASVPECSSCDSADCSPRGRAAAHTPALDAPAAAFQQQQAPRVKPMRKCASTPTLHSMSAACGDQEGMEVYVTLRNFKV